MSDLEILRRQLIGGAAGEPRLRLPALGVDSRERVFVHSAELEGWALGRWVISSWDGTWAADIAEARARAIDLLRAAWQAEVLTGRFSSARPGTSPTPADPVQFACEQLASVFSRELDAAHPK
jgi:hypothetical protein